uniref:Uncharacterized protein n=1 Tax=Romanomermis culicivorax TaxID=13658 RepID=A0A915IJW4_ROMCU
MDGMPATVDNPKVIPRFVSSAWFQHINNGSYVSDTFLLLSGFLLCFWFMKQTHDMREIMSLNFWARFYAKRFT